MILSGAWWKGQGLVGMMDREGGPAAIYSPVTLSLSIVACLRVMNVRHDNLILIYMVSEKTYCVVDALTKETVPSPWQGAPGALPFLAPLALWAPQRRALLAGVPVGPASGHRGARAAGLAELRQVSCKVVAGPDGAGWAWPHPAMPAGRLAPPPQRSRCTRPRPKRVQIQAPPPPACWVSKVACCGVACRGESAACLAC